MEYISVKTKDKEEVIPFTTWSFLELRPTGKIETREQYDYVNYYAVNNYIDTRYIKSFEESVGKYLHLGDWFGGASFYFYYSDKPENIDGHFEENSPKYEKFSYGKCGELIFT